jgi:predicted transcriptional regulator
MAGYKKLYWVTRPRVITDTDLRVLEVLVHYPPPHFVGVVASAAGLSPSTVARVLKRLATMGVLTKHRCCGPGRRPGTYMLHPEWQLQQLQRLPTNGRARNEASP